MRTTLDEALQAIFNGSGQQDSTMVQPEMAMGNTAKVLLSGKAKEALGHYNKAVEYLKQNDWNGYGKELMMMKAILSEMSADKATSPGKIRQQKK
jgi:uncharacterized membrane protein (UPF0182 family)